MSEIIFQTSYSKERHTENYSVFAMRQDGTSLGTAVGRIMRRTNEGVLDSIFVFPDSRNCGVGTALLQEFIKYMYDERAKVITGIFFPEKGQDPNDVKAFYTKNGFEVIDDLSLLKKF